MADAAANTASLKKLVEQAHQQGVPYDQIWSHIQNRPDVQGLLQKVPASQAQQYLFGEPLGPSAPTTIQDEPQQSGEFINKAKRVGEIAGEYAGRGIVGAAGLPGDLEYAAVHGVNWLGNALGLGSPMNKADLENTVLPTSWDLLGKLNDFESQTGGVVQPEGKGENLLAGVASGIGGAATLGGTVARTLVTGAASGGLAEVAHELLPDSIVAPMVAGAIGGLGSEGFYSKFAGHLLGKAVKGAEGKLADKNFATQAAKDTYDEYQRTAEDLSLAKRNMTADHSRIYSAAKEQHLQNQDALATARDNQIQSTTGEANNTINNVTDRMGGYSTHAESGQVAQEHANDWLSEKMPDQIEKAQAPWKKEVPNTIPTPLDAFRGALSQQVGKGGLLKDFIADTLPNLPIKWKNRLESWDKLQEQGLQDRVTPTIEEVGALRTAIGKMTPKDVNSIGAQRVNHLYSALTADMRSAIGKENPDALDLFDQANKESKALYNVRDNTIQSIADNPSPETISQRLLAGKGKSTDLAALREHTPEAADALASTAIKQNQWTRLSPESQKALVPDDGTRQQINEAIAQRDSAKSTASEAYNAGLKKSLENLNSIAKQHELEASDLTEKILENDRNKVIAKRAYNAAKGATSEAQAALKVAQTKAGKSYKPAGAAALGSLGLGVGTLGLEQLGEQFGNVMEHFAGFGPGSGPLGAVALGSLPLAAHAIGSVIENPGILKDPAIGAYIGHILALSGEQKEQQKQNNKNELAIPNK